MVEMAVVGAYVTGLAIASAYYRAKGRRKAPEPLFREVTWAEFWRATTGGRHHVRWVNEGEQWVEGAAVRGSDGWFYWHGNDGKWLRSRPRDTVTTYTA